MRCTNCSIEKSQRSGQWWFLGGYYGISGTFCPGCYELVSHDSYGKPRHPKAYQQIKEKQK